MSGSSVKEIIAINRLLEGALAGGTLRVGRRSPDIFYLQAMVADGTYVTINVFDFNAIPGEQAKEVVPAPPVATEAVAEQEEAPTNVVPFRPTSK